MRIKEARPKEKGLILRLILRDERVTAFGDPVVIVEFFGNWPFSALCPDVARRLQVIIAPVAQAFFFHPQRVMLPDMGFIGVVAGELDVIETIKGTGEVLPEIQVMQGRVGFQ